MWEVCELWPEGGLWHKFLEDGHNNIPHVTQCDFATSPIEK